MVRYTRSSVKLFCLIYTTWWRHQMETFSALLTLCAGNSPVTGEFPSQRPVARSFDVFFDLCLNKRLSKQSQGWWFETLSRALWRHCNDISNSCFSPWHEDVNLGSNLKSSSDTSNLNVKTTYRPMNTKTFKECIAISSVPAFRLDMPWNHKY